VEIAEPGAPPAVEEIEVQRTQWIERRDPLEEDAHVDALAAWLDALPRKSMTLVSLTLEGSLPASARVRLDALLERHQEELMLLRVNTDELHDRAEDADLGELAGDGVVGRAAASLRAAGTRASADALRMLYRFVIEQRDGAGEKEA
jgi:hypothetical protein